MPVGDVINLLRQKPGYVIYYITSRCNARCNFCSNWKWVNAGDGPGAELDLGEIERMAANLKPLYQLSISGGEPFLRDDLAEAAEILCNRAGVRTLSIPTNASLPGRIHDVMQKLLPQIPGVQVTLYLSVDGVGELHDRIRGMPSLFDKVLESRRVLAQLACSHPNLLVYLNVTVQKQNAEKLGEVFDFFRGENAVDGAALAVVRGELPDEEIKAVVPETLKKVEDRYLRFLKECPPGRGKRVRNAILATSMNYIDRFRLTGKAVIPCFAGDNLVVIGSDGEVKPCEMLDISFGNLRDVDFDIRKLVDSEKAERFRTQVRKSCACDWECGMRAGVVFAPRAWGAVARRILFP